MASTLLEGGTTGSSRNADIAPDPQGELAACGGLPSTLGPVGTCPGDPLPAGIVVISDVIMDGGPDRIFPYHSPSIRVEDGNFIWILNPSRGAAACIIIRTTAGGTDGDGRAHVLGRNLQVLNHSDHAIVPAGRVCDQALSIQAGDAGGGSVAHP